VRVRKNFHAKQRDPARENYPNVDVIYDFRNSVGRKRLRTIIHEAAPRESKNFPSFLSRLVELRFSGSAG